MIKKWKRQHDIDVKNPSLTIAQEILYKLIYRKLEEKKPIHIDEVRRIYIHYGCRYTKDGVPHCAHFFYENGQWKPEFTPMDEWQVKIAATKWLTHNMGILILKGYLKATPTVSLEELESAKQITNQSLKRHNARKGEK